MNNPQYRIVCDLPYCGLVTFVSRSTDCLIWLDKDDNGGPVFMQVCPEHKAKFLRLVSDFAENK